MPNPFTIPVGGVTLGGIKFNTDPIPYRPYQWKKRHSILPGLGGSVTIQDFGAFDGDTPLELGSGDSQFLSEDKVQALKTLFFTRGATPTLEDWLGNSFSVFFREFEAEPVKKAGGTVLYRYKMALQQVQT